MSKPQGRLTALALAAALAMGAYTSDAQALALGRVTVQSALGEPLRVEIDIPEINADEVASLKATVASPDAFRAAGLEYSPALANVVITLQRRSDGRYFLRLTSDRPVNDPFVDLILETNWASGRIVRDYTMLFDPPNLRQPAPAVAAQSSPVAPPPAVQPSTVQSAPAPRAAAQRGGSTRGRGATERAAAPSAVPAPAPAPTPSGNGKQVTVRPGDTATRIANANRPQSVSLDQMLVAMLRSNPDAFAGNNVNRLRAGAVLEIPSADQAGSVSEGEASQVLVAQSRDFNEYRRRLAEGLPVREMRSSERVASGKVQAQVEDKKPSAAAPDRLTLSAKGGAQGKAAADKVARDRAAQDASTRVAELNKNISDLNNLGTGKGTAAAGTASAAKPGVPVAAAPSMAKPASAPAPAMAASSASKAASAPAATASRPASAPLAAATPAATASAAATPASAAPPPVMSAASAPMATSSPSPAASAAMAAASDAAAVSASTASSPSAAASEPAPVVAAAPASAPKPVPNPAAKAPAPPPPEPSLLDDLMQNPLIPAGAVALLATLLGLGFYKIRQRRQAAQVDSSFLESRLQPDSFFGASGGQRIDTAESSSNATGSSMVYSPSQLDAAGDVDPVAEADVYLAYGRDLQAEEILKEALRTNPQRVAIHAKLLEIYAKRRDAKAFELVATEAYNLTHGQGPEWEHICEMGRELDATNPMYRPGGQPDATALAAAASVTQPGSFGSTTALSSPAPEPAAANPAVDLDLDFSLGDDEPAAPLPPPALEPTISLDVPKSSAPAPAPSLDVDFGGTMAIDTPAPAAASARLDAPDLTLNENSLNFDTSPAPVAIAPPPAAAAPANDSGMIEFDMGALSLDLPGDKKGSDTASSPISTSGAPLSTGGLEPDSSGDPLATKLALAEEFNAIGDPDGARSLAQEVLAEASGDLKSRAQRLLAEIG